MILVISYFESQIIFKTFLFYNTISRYAIRESNSVVKIFKNFKEKKSFKPDFGAEGKYLLLK